MPAIPDSQQSLAFAPPSLPKGGGSISDGGGALQASGPSGTSSFSIPLPVQVGRGMAPSLSLQYNNSGGNSEFGMGWQCAVPAIRRQTRLGVPRYDAQDVMTGPDGEALLSTGETRTARALLHKPLRAAYTVTCYLSRISAPQERLEYWQSQDTKVAHDFWLLYTPDGTLTLFGWSENGKLSDPQAPQHVAEWYAEESVSACGEHILYNWRRENTEACSEEETRLHPFASNRYLNAVFWGNVKPAAHFLLTDANTPPTAEDWLFCVRFDYGERNLSSGKRPEWSAEQPWAVREDCFSRYDYGFEVRTRRLCHHLLFFTRTALLEGKANAAPELVAHVRLAYDASPVVTVMTACQRLGYEANGQTLTTPPLEFEMTRPAGSDSGEWVSHWHALPTLDGYAPTTWQMVDLLGEGTPGILFRHTGAWWYRAPLQADEGESNVIRWSSPEPLSTLPRSEPGGLLTDLDSNGRLDWVVNVHGRRGYFTLTPEGDWSQFIPLGAVPMELSAPEVQLADLNADGIQDVVLVGPHSVRLWPGRRNHGWSAHREVQQAEGMRLPLFTQDPRRLVAFSDILGSGQQHLVEITADGVTVWPNTGHGQFATPLTLPGFNLPTDTVFSPERVVLADTDGSGTVDILYLHKKGVQVFINRSGNSFYDAGMIPTPEDVNLDNTCHLQVADVQGLGVGSLLLTIPHPVPRTWMMNLNTQKPWLLSETCNNLGSRTLLTYRSSAQEWLQEKAKLLEQGKKPICYLPFPVHTLHQVCTVNDITGHRFISETRYSQGVWDGRQREFRGFSLVVQTDTSLGAHGSAQEVSPPAQTKSWFLSGIPERDTSLKAAFWLGEQIYALKPSRFTQYDIAKEQDELMAPEGESRYWLHRALKGHPLRTEVYGLDGSDHEPVPYSVTHHRYQVRQMVTAKTQEPAALVTPLETLSMSYERIVSDPQVAQTVILDRDALGTVMRTVDIRYPRLGRLRPEDYPNTLPEGLLEASRDEQQSVCWLMLERATWHHLRVPTEGEWVIALPDGKRTDALDLSWDRVPPKGFSAESFDASDSPLIDLSQATLAGQQKTFWCAGDPTVLLNTPSRQALVAFTETAVFDEQSLEAFSPELTKTEIHQNLQTGGYRQVPVLFDRPEAPLLWASRNNLTWYGGVATFWKPEAIRPSELVGRSILTRDPHTCVVTSMTDATGLVTRAVYDWRFLQPNQVTDVNDNVQTATFDALGRIQEQRFRGTENGSLVGYSTRTFTPPSSVEEALALRNIPVSGCFVTVTDSWMPRRRNREGQVEKERCGELALRRQWQREHPQTPLTMLLNERQPPHVITLKTDRYDNDPEQQVRINVGLSDGFGRVLQATVLSESGNALVRTEIGGLETDAQGKAVTRMAAQRWAVSGRTEYDHKGAPIRIWQPLYLNDWRWVSDDSGREAMYADTHFYDALGREYRVVTAAGWERATQYFPWFTAVWDENDTAHTVLENRKAANSLS